jgi:hypothetical protein
MLAIQSATRYCPPGSPESCRGMPRLTATHWGHRARCTLARTWGGAGGEEDGVQKKRLVLLFVLLCWRKVSTNVELLKRLVQHNGYTLPSGCGGSIGVALVLLIVQRS